jgi:LCP family protein required for cell wall assembly
MNLDHTEIVIREAVTAEAGRAVDPGTVLAELHRRGTRTARRRVPVMVATAAVVVIAAVGAVVVPQLLKNNSAQLAVSGTAVSQNVLLVGVDDNGYADSIVLAHLGADGSGAIISLPRDSWVQGAELNSAYITGGIGKLVTTVQDLTGVKVDHWATVRMASFDRLSTAVGGVPVCLRAAAHDTYSGTTLPAGQQTVEGASALAFLRQRRGLPNGDLDRVVRLQAFLRSLAHQMLAGSALTDQQALSTLLNTVRDDVRVDPGWDLLAFAGQVRGLHTDQLRIATIPVGNQIFQTPAGADAIAVNPEQVRQFVMSLTEDAPAGGAPAIPENAAPSSDVPCVN